MNRLGKGMARQPDLEDRPRRENIRIDGPDEYESERWEETQVLLIETFSNNLGLKNLKPERAHRIGDLKVSMKHTITAKLARTF